MKRLGEVYVVDDDNIYTFLFKRQAGRVDFCNSLRFFNHGGEALEALYVLRDQPDKLPDLILLDLNMPVCDGWQFLDRFSSLSLQKTIPVDIISSTITPAEHRLAVQNPGVGNFYEKPVTLETLTTILKMNSASRSMQR
jgi:CheY-like chemotaxis protein